MSLADNVIRKIVESETNVSFPNFRDWRVTMGLGINSAKIYPNRPGKKFSQEEINELKRWLSDIGWTIFRCSATKIEVVGKISSSWTELIGASASGKKSEIWKEKKLNREKERENEKIKDEITAKSRKSYTWIVSTFGEDVINYYNSIALSDFLEGISNKFKGIANQRWIDGVIKANALDSTGTNIDWKKLKQAYEEFTH